MKRTDPPPIATWMLETLHCRRVATKRWQATSRRLLFWPFGWLVLASGFRGLCGLVVREPSCAHSIIRLCASLVHAGAGMESVH